MSRRRMEFLRFLKATRRTALCHRARVVTRPLVHIVVLFAYVVLWHSAAHAQSSISSVELRPFVVGVVPVVGNGAVGGVAIDARGVIERAEQRDVAALRDARRSAISGVAADIAKPSKLRKISLRRLDALIAQLINQNKPLPSELLYLAGLQRIEYVFAYPDQSDVVLAGPAGGWTVDDAGNVVGSHSRAAVLQLVDLIAALRTTDKLLAGELISCSIDPTPEGLKRFTRVMRSAPTSPSEQFLRQIEQAMGPQKITLTGVPPESHFAQVLVAADWQMKRLGMGLAPSPVSGLPSYLELLKDDPGWKLGAAQPRWWIAYGQEPVERDAEGLGWRISRPGIKVLTAAGRMGSDGRIANQTASDPMATKWADAMTAHYDQLAIAEPVFAQLRGCMDLGLITAVLASSHMLANTGLELPMLLDDKRLRPAPHRVPKSVAAQASALRASNKWVVSVSGGVELDITHVVNAAEEQAEVRAARIQASSNLTSSWWWD
jgi:hypothetical protein